MVNLALAVAILAFLLPLAARFGSLPLSAQVLLGSFGALFGLLAFACLASAARPGSLGRFARRHRRTSPRG